LTSQVLILILALAFLAVVLVLARGVTHRGGSLKTWFKAPGVEFGVDYKRKQQVDTHLQAAAAAKPGGLEDVEEARSSLAKVSAIRPANVLWVDDNPDNNINEVLMLRDLGLSITQTLSTENANRYLNRAHFDLVITDIGRERDRRAGISLLEELNQRHLPAIVYTFGPDERAKEAEAAGARAVTWMPSKLLEAVLREIEATEAQPDSPLDVLRSIMRDPKAPAEARVSAAAKLADAEAAAAQPHGGGSAALRSAEGPS
jgi:CheY-like chemotaxis protein